MKQRLTLLLCVGVTSCFGIPPPTDRALQCNELCVRYLSANDLEHAEIQCDLGIQFSPQYADLWVNKGLIALRREQLDRAKELFIKALRLNQAHAQAYNNLGYIYLKALSYGTAHDNFEKALAVNPDYTEARYNLALSYIGLKQPEKARRELRTILEINPGLADPHLHLGALAMQDGANVEAIDEFTKATQLDPNFTIAWLNMGNAYMEAGKPCEGKDSYSACIEIEEDNAECRNNIVIAERKCRLQDKALDDVKARQAGLKTPEGEYTMALQFRDKGAASDEERAYKRCLRYDPKYAQCHFGLFEIYKGRSDERNATKACKNFLMCANEADFRTQMATCQQYVRD